MPCAELPHASIGDGVMLAGDEGGVNRTGTIADESDHDGERFWRINLDPTDPDPDDDDGT